MTRKYHEQQTATDLDDTDCLWPDERLVLSRVDGDGGVAGAAAPSPRDAKPVDGEARLCTSLSWVRRGPSGLTGLPLLAACFAGGVAVYRVPPAPAASGADAPSPRPLAAARFTSSSEWSEALDGIGGTRVRLPRGAVAWAGAGPRSPPFLVLSLSCERTTRVPGGAVQRVDTSRACLLAVDVPWHGRPGSAEGGRGRPRPIGVVCQSPLGGATDGSRDAVVVAGPSPSIVRYDGLGRLSALVPTALPPSPAGATSAGPREDDFFASLSRPVSSAALGLDSDGAVHFGGPPSPAVTNDYRDSILSVFTVTTCAGQDGAAADPSVPSQRHWLLMSSPGDTAADVESSPPSEDPDGAVVEMTSATTDVLFELTCAENPESGLAPGRVVRENSGRRVAVLFSPGFFGGGHGAEGDDPDRVRTRTDVRRDPVAYAILDLVSRSSTRRTALF